MSTASLMEVPEGAQAPPALLAPALRAVVIAERLLQVVTDDATASLSPLSPAERRRYVDAASVAIALLDPSAGVAAAYVAAHRVQDLRAQSPLQRRGLVQLTQDIVERYLETLAGYHARTEQALAPLVVKDLRAAARPGGVI